MKVLGRQVEVETRYNHTLKIAWVYLYGDQIPDGEVHSKALPIKSGIAKVEITDTEIRVHGIMGELAVVRQDSIHQLIDAYYRTA